MGVEWQRCHWSYCN